MLTAARIALLHHPNRKTEKQQKVNQKTAKTQPQHDDTNSLMVCKKYYG